MAGAGGATQRKLRIAVVDRQPIFRAGVKACLAEHVEVVAEGETAAHAIEIAERHDPEIVLTDSYENIAGSPHFVAEFARGWPAIKLVLLTGSRCNNAAAAALRNGARGYVLKEASGADLYQALSLISAGEVYVSPTLGAQLLMASWPTAHTTAPARGTAGTSELTRRELEVISQVSLGATNREIARTLNITEKTVKHYMTSIMQKLDVRNRVEAVVAVRDRLKASA